ncbi:hypothetical protein B0T13DRAFT_37425 [Neurospora crassa]|nr:hypothetical protein B0T13DRAFT_37425 [Neurospora crassa]
MSRRNSREDEQCNKELLNELMISTTLSAAQPFLNKDSSDRFFFLFSFFFHHRVAINDFAKVPIVVGSRWRQSYSDFFVLKRRTGRRMEREKKKWRPCGSYRQREAIADRSWGLSLSDDMDMNRHRNKHDDTNVLEHISRHPGEDIEAEFADLFNDYAVQGRQSGKDISAREEKGPSRWSVVSLTNKEHEPEVGALKGVDVACAPAICSRSRLETRRSLTMCWAAPSSRTGHSPEHTDWNSPHGDDGPILQ